MGEKPNQKWRIKMKFKMNNFVKIFFVHKTSQANNKDLTHQIKKRATSIFDLNSNHKLALTRCSFYKKMSPILEIIATILLKSTQTSNTYIQLHLCTVTIPTRTEWFRDIHVSWDFYHEIIQIFCFYRKRKCEIFFINCNEIHVPTATWKYMNGRTLCLN